MSDAKKKRAPNNGNGRPPGTPNKFTSLKDTFLETFIALQKHPTANLVRFSEGFPKEFYAIVAKMLPQNIKSDINHEKFNITISIEGKRTGVIEAPKVAIEAAPEMLKHGEDAYQEAEEDGKQI